MHNYLIFGDEEYLINKEIKDIIKKNNITNDDIIYYDLEKDKVDNALIDASTISMFMNNKLIICDNSSFLTGDSKKDMNHDLDYLINYLNNPSDFSYMIFVVHNVKLDERKKIVKEMKKLCKVSEHKKIENYDLNNYLKKYITDNGYKISNNDINLIIKKVGLDLSLLISEIDKLFIYKDNDKDITSKDINEIIINNLEDNVFSLTNAIVNNNKKEIFDIYNDLIKAGLDPSYLLVILSNQFRLLLSVKLMQKQGYTDNEMVKEIKEHPYRIKLSKETNFSKDKLIMIIKNLSELDYKIKSGNIDRFLGFEMFLLNI